MTSGRRLFSTTIALAFLVVLVSVRGLVAQPAPLATGGDLTAEEWQEDIRHFHRMLPETHMEPFHTMSREQFDEAVWNLHRQVPDMADHEVVVELARIVTMVNDGHTRLRLYDTPWADWNAFGQYALIPYQTESGVHVLAADSSHPRIVGGRILGIGNRTIREALESVRPLVPRDNVMGIRRLAPRYLSVPEVLHATGLAPGRDKATYRVETVHGDTVRATFRWRPQHEVPWWNYLPEFSAVVGDSGVSRVTARETSSPPRWLSRTDETFWFERLADQDALYVQLNAIANSGDTMLPEFFADVFAEWDRDPAEKFVLDLRLNGGGNNMLNNPVITGIVEREGLNTKGRFYVLISRYTFSAAGHLVTYLERFTNAIFVGEPTGASPNHYGDAPPFYLPNSGVRVTASAMYWQNSLPSAFEDRDWTPPYLAAPLTIEAYRKGEDPGLRTAVSNEWKGGLRGGVERALADGADPEEVRQVYSQFASDPQHRYVDTKGEINSLGHDLRRQGRVDEAIIVFRINTERHPDDPNIWESLGNGYEAQGDSTQARKAYLKALEIDPEFEDAIEGLRSVSGN